MEYLYIALGTLIGILILLFLISLFIHHAVFKNRYEPDGVIKYYTEEDFIGLKSEAIEIPTKKGSLRGKLYFYTKEASAIILFSHGMWGSHSAYVQEIEYLAKNGFLVLGFDYYGTERSDGKNIKGLGNSLLSLNEAVTYVKKNFSEKSIYVMGHSWGGFAALGIAKYHPDIQKIVAMSPFIQLSQILRHMLPRPLRILIPFIVAIDFMKCGRYSLVKAKKVLKSTKSKTLILHSTDDQMVPYLTATGYLKKHIQNENVKYFIQENKGHNPDYSLDALAYTKETFLHLKALPKEEKLDYRKSIDYHRMGMLDENVMNKIAQFLKN